jgi:hypothetical protein
MSSMPNLAACVASRHRAEELLRLIQAQPWFERLTPYAPKRSAPPPGDSSSACATYVLDIAITPDQMLEFYRGRVQSVISAARDGRRISLPLTALRPFVTHGGVCGTFAVTTDRAHRLLSVVCIPAR